MPRPRSDAPERIQTAAATLLAAEGPGALSFDRLAKHTGLSKGGVLHHFRSRSSLVSSLVARVVDDLEDRIEARMSDHQVSFASAYVSEVLLDVDRRAGAPLLAAIAMDPALLAPLWEHRTAWRKRLGADLGGDALLVQGVLENLWLGALLGEPGLDSAARAKLRSQLLQLTG